MDSTSQQQAPWWRYGHVWLVIAGPVAVVLAALATAWIAIANPDPVLAPDKSMTPAVQGRNHAATPPAASR